MDAPLTGGEMEPSRDGFRGSFSLRSPSKFLVLQSYDQA